MARITIPVDQLPPTNSIGNHFIRFRVSSEDRNSVSEWSQCFNILSIGQINPTQVNAQVVALKEGGPYEVNWKEDTEINLPSGSTIKRTNNTYDIFVRWSYDANFNFYARVLTNFITIFEEEAATSLRVVGQLTTYPFPPVKIEEIQVFDTGVVDL